MIALALVGAGNCPRVVLQAGGASGASECLYDIPISAWKNQPNSIGGQYFVFVASLFILIATIVAIFLAVTDSKIRLAVKKREFATVLIVKILYSFF